MKANLHICFFLLLLFSALACDSGSFLDSTGLCQQCDISCNTCKSSDGCSTCYDQMFLVARGNLIVCDLCYNVNKGCDICLTSSKCQNCSAGYFLQSDNTCESCSGMYPNCLLCNIGNYTQCMSCKNPYLLINGQCVINGTASSDQTTAEDTTIPVQQSSSSNSAGASMSVSQAYQAVMGLSTFQQEASSICDPSQVSINGTCYPAIAFCLTYSQTNGSCLTCSSVFVLNNGYCLPSTLITQAQPVATAPASPAQPNCSSRQYYNNGVCNDVGPQCLQFDSLTGKCYVCAPGFTALNGLCIQQAPPTSSISNANQSNSSSSSSNLPHCLTTNPTDSSHCLVCVSGYTIVDELPGVCFQIN